MRYTVVVKKGLFWVKDSLTNEEITWFKTWQGAIDYCNARN